MNSILKSTASILLLFVSTAIFAQEFKTPLKVSKGQEFSYQSDVIMVMTMNQAGMEMKINNTTTATNKYKVENVLSSGNIELLWSTWDVTNHANMMGKDTTMKINGKVSPTYKSNIDKYGNIVSKQIVDSTSASELGSQFGGESKLVNSGIFCEFPQKNLQVGEKWNKTLSDTVSNMGMKLALTIKTEYTLGASEVIEGKPIQKITFKSDIEIGGKGNMQGMDMYIEGTGVSNGVINIDPVSKVVNTSKSDIEMDMNMAISGAQSMTIPITQKMTVTNKLKK
jgi:hypothetical protein